MDRLARIEGLLVAQQNASAVPSGQGHGQGPSPYSTPATPPTLDDGKANKLQASMCGMLINSPSGHVRFISQYPGIDVMDAGLLISISQNPHSEGTYQIDTSFGCENSFSKQEILDLLPPLSQCDQLKSMYLEVFSPLLHILHEPSFNIAYEEFRREPSSVPLAFLALLFVIFGIAVTTVTDDDPLLTDLGHDSDFGSKIKRLSTKYQSAAMKALSADRFMWQHNLNTIKALVLLIYSLSHTNGPAWSILGSTLHIATAIGCHVDPLHLIGVSLVEAEERRRCWAAILMLHTIQNACLGILAPITVAANTSLPADLEDEEIGDFAPMPTPALSSRTTSKMTYILHKFKLYQIAAELCHLPRPGIEVDYACVSTYDQQIGREQYEQAQKFELFENLPVYHQAQYYVLKIYTNHLFLVLHRPCLHVHANISDTHRNMSLQRCRNSAMEIIQCYDQLCANEKLRRYGWYIQGLGAFYALLAASTLIISVNHPVFLEQPSWPIFDQLQALYSRYAEMSHRSALCEKALRFLKRHVDWDGRRVDSYDEEGRVCNDTQNISTVSAPLADGSTDNAASSISPGIDGTIYSSELFDFVSESSHQQWLSPMSFSWEHLALV